MTYQNHIRRIFKDKFEELKRKRQECLSRPLSSKEVSSLLNMRFNCVRVYIPSENAGPMSKAEAEKLLRIKNENRKPKYTIEDITTLRDATIPIEGNYFTSVKLGFLIHLL